MRAIVLVVACVLAGCGGDAERDSDSGRADTLAWIAGERERVLAELPDDATPCDRADAWVAWIRSDLGWVQYAKPESYLPGVASDPSFADLCVEYLSDDEAECVVDADLGEGAECCLRGTELYVPSESNWSDAECDEGWYL